MQGSNSFAHFIIALLTFNMSFTRSLMKGISILNRCPLTSSIGIRSCTSLKSAKTYISEVLLIPNDKAGTETSVLSLMSMRPNLKLHVTNKVNEAAIIWSAHRGNLQLDSAILEPLYLGQRKLTENETAAKWHATLNSRLSVFNGNNFNDKMKSTMDLVVPALGDGGKLQSELDAAIAAVQKASFMSRSMQRFLLRGRGAQSKNDRSPVTIADFAVQALIIKTLHEKFPHDKFIAEESSEVLRENESIRNGVLDALEAATGKTWTADELYDTIDLGQFEGTAERVWVLDPIDGTKGFMRGEHYCIALAFMLAGKPELSVLGCPNVYLQRVLQPEQGRGEGVSTSKYIASVPEGITVSLAACDTVGGGSDVVGDGAVDSKIQHSDEVCVYPTAAGSVFFAATGRGAFARSLSMELGAAFEVQVSMCPDPTDSALCEAVEASHGDRDVTKRVFDSLKLRKEFIRLDGQCKYAIVGAGAAEGNMRLPPSGYREKIWDHAGGSHFIIEAGGQVTDLNGKRLDFSQGRFLAEDVTGILSSNGLLHEKFLAAINEAKKIEEDEVIAGRKPKKVFGEDQH